MCVWWCVGKISLYRFFFKFGDKLYLISPVFLLFFLNLMKNCRHVCFLVT